MQTKTEITNPKYLLHLTWPVFIELLLQMLVGNVDQMMVSHYSQVAVGAIANANQIMNVLLLTFNIVCTATTILVSQYLGSGNKERMSQIYTLVMLVNVALSLVVGAVLLTFNHQIFSWMKIPAELMRDSQMYIELVGGCIFLQAVFMTFSAIFRSNALMRESMLVSIVINVVNIIGNAIMINGVSWLGVPAMGVVGAAHATNLGRLAGVLIMVYLFIKRLNTPIAPRFLRPFPTDLLKKLMGIGIPSSCEGLSYNLTQVCIQKFVNSFGTFVITARVYSSMFANFSYLFSSAVGQACQIIVGHLIGAKDTDSADKEVLRTNKMAIVVAAVIALLVWLCSDPLFSLFTDNPEVIRLGKIIMLIEIPLEIGRAVNIVMIRCLQAAGDIKFTVVVAIIFEWCLAVGLGFLLSIVCGLGLVGIWLAMMCDECVRAVICFIRWKSGKWKTKRLVS